MISTNDFRTGLTIKLEGEVYTVVDFQHVKPGKGAAFVRSKLKNIRTGSVTERTFRAAEKVESATLIVEKCSIYIRPAIAILLWIPKILNSLH